MNSASSNRDHFIEDSLSIERMNEVFGKILHKLGNNMNELIEMRNEMIEIHRRFNRAEAQIKELEDKLEQTNKLKLEYKSKCDELEDTNGEWYFIVMDLQATLDDIEGKVAKRRKIVHPQTKCIEPETETANCSSETCLLGQDETNDTSMKTDSEISEHEHENEQSGSTSRRRTKTTPRRNWN